MQVSHKDVLQFWRGLVRILLSAFLKCVCKRHWNFFVQESDLDMRKSVTHKSRRVMQIALAFFEGLLTSRNLAFTLISSRDGRASVKILGFHN